MPAHMMAGPNTLISTPLRASNADMPTRIAVPGHRMERKQKLSRKATMKATGPVQPSFSLTNVTMASTNSCTFMKWLSG